MTISTEVTFKRTTGNGATTAFSFPYHFFEDGDLIVYLETIADGTATLQVLDTDYTVSGADEESGGTVTFVTPPAATHTVVIIRKPDFTQTVNFTSFVAGTANDALDRLYEHLQYAEWVRTRTIGLPDTAASATLEIPHTSLRASKALGFDANGDLTLYTNAEDIQASATASATLAQEWATKTDGLVDSSDYSAKAYSIGGTGVTNAAGAAKEWAITAEDTPVSGANYSALHYAAKASASATAASTAQTAAETAQTAAELAETNAETAQAAAEAAQTAAETAQAAAEAASENPAFFYNFDSATVDADPGDGDFRFNNGTVASATEIYFDNLDANGNTVTDWLDSFDDSTNSTSKGLILIKGIQSPTAFAVARVTGTVTDGTGYRKVTATIIASGGTFTNGEQFSVIFSPTGDAGEVTLALLASTSNGEGASLIGIEDSGGLITATDVEGALAEIAADIDNNYQPLDELLTEIAALSTDPNADSLLFFDDSAGNIAYGTPANGLEFSGTNLQITSSLRTSAIVVDIDGGGSVIETGVKTWVRVPFDCTITANELTADQSGSIVIDIWKDTYANYPPDDADSITASAPPTLSSAIKSQDSTLTGWTTSISAGDYLYFNVDSVTTVEHVVLELVVTRT